MYNLAVSAKDYYVSQQEMTQMDSPFNSLETIPKVNSVVHYSILVTKFFSGEVMFSLVH